MARWRSSTPGFAPKAWYRSVSDALDSGLPALAKFAQWHAIVEEVRHRIQAIDTGRHDHATGPHSVQLRPVHARRRRSTSKGPNTIQQLAAGADDHHVRGPQALLPAVVQRSHALLCHRVLGNLRNAGVRAHAALKVAIDQVIIVLIRDWPESAQPISGRFKLAHRHA